MKIKSVRAENFLSFKKLKYDFEDSGLCGITGPNGSGKSTLLGVVSYGLYGKLPRATKVDEVISWFSGKNLYIELELEIKGKSYSVIRTRKHADYGNDLLIFDGENRIRKESIMETQKYLESLIGITYNMYVNGMYFDCQSSTGNILYCTDANRRKLFNEITGLDYWDNYFSQIKVKYTGAREEEALLTARISELELSSQDKSYHDLKLKAADWEKQKLLKLASLNASQKEFDLERTNKIRNLEKEAKQVESSINQLRTLLEKEDDKELERSKLYVEYSDLKSNLSHSEANDKALELLQESLENISSEIKDLDSKIYHLQNSEGQECHTCGGTICKDKSLKVIQAHKESRDVFLEKGKTEFARYKQLLDSIIPPQARENIRCKLLDMETKLRELELSMSNKNKLKASLENNISALSKRVEKINTLKSEKNSFKDQVKDLESEKNPFKDLLAQYEEQHKAIKERTQHLQNKLKSVSAQKDIWDLWKSWEKKFKLNLIHNSIITINNFISDFLNELTSGIIACEFMISDKDKLNILITNNSHQASFHALSFGEQALVRFSVQMAFYKFIDESVGQSIPFIMLDEIFNGMDSANKSKALELLKTNLIPSDSIYIIDHSPEVIDKLDTQIKLTKVGDVSEIT